METRVTALDRGNAQRSTTRMGVIVAAVVLQAIGLWIEFTPANASTNPEAVRCGNGSPPDYGFTFDLRQEHWTVNWQDYVSDQAVTEVDAVLDQLNADSIAQTMILFQSQDQVGVRVNCAVHFLRYMRLGLPAGERKDNGFVFLIVVEPTSIDVHYAVGLGLPALTASELTTINRDAEYTYESTGNMDQALLTLVREFDLVSRNNYAPLIAPVPTQELTDLVELPAGPLGLLTICGLLCLGILLVGFLLCGFPTSWPAPGSNLSPIVLIPSDQVFRLTGAGAIGGRAVEEARGWGVVGSAAVHRCAAVVEVGAPGAVTRKQKETRI